MKNPAIARQSADAASPPVLAEPACALAGARWALPALLALAVYIAFFLNLGGFALFDVDEGAFSEATREMLERGDYVTTYLNGNLRFDKPILVYWLQAACASLLGIDAFSFRLPSALAALGWITAILVFTGRQTDRVTGYAAALLAATAAGVAIIGRAATADALLNLFLALTMFDIFRYMRQPLARYRRRAYLWMGLGLLAKGPVALAIPCAASAIAFLLHGRPRDWLRAALDPAGWAILLAVAAPWYVLEYLRQGQAFIDGFLMRHNVERFMNPLQGHGGHPFYYLPAALLLLLPHSGLFIRTLPSLRKMRDKPLDTLLWSWFLFVLVFFSFAKTKLPHYLLYGVTPLFVLMAMHRHALRSRWLAFVPPFLLSGLAAALPALLQRAAPRMRNPYFREMLMRGEVFGASYHLLAWGLLAAMLLVAMARRAAIWERLAVMGILCTLSLATLILPAVAELQQGPVREAAAVAGRLGLAVKTWRINVPSFSVYWRQTTSSIDMPAPGDVILTRSDKLGDLQGTQGVRGVEVLYRKGGVVLANIL